INAATHIPRSVVQTSPGLSGSSSWHSASPVITLSPARRTGPAVVAPIFGVGRAFDGDLVDLLAHVGKEFGGSPVVAGRKHGHLDHDLADVMPCFMDGHLVVRDVVTLVVAVVGGRPRTGLVDRRRLGK